MSPAVFINGFGLASSLGLDLTSALQYWHAPPTTQHRNIRGLADPLPYFAIPHTATSWKERCAYLLRHVVAESGCSNPHGTLYIASASMNVGAVESGESFLSYPEFLAEIAQTIAWQGPVHWINTACTSSLNALIAAKFALEEGIIDDALIIGFELENQLSIAGFAAMQLLSNTDARPFARDRDGLVLGEAVAAIHLSRTHGRWRLVGGVHCIDSSQTSGASVSAYQDMLQKTLTQANWTKDTIDLIKVQAAGSPINDAVEANAIKAFFENKYPALISLKPYLGHTLGASGAAEITLLLAMIANRKWPKTNKTDESLEVELAVSTPTTIKRLLTCILGFGGSHCCVAIEDSSI